MNLSISQVLEFLTEEKFEPEYSGRENAYVTGFCPLSGLIPNRLVWVRDLDSFDIETIEENQNLIIISNKQYNGEKKLNIISVQSPRAAYFSVLSEFFTEKTTPCVAPNAVILSDKIGEGASIGYNCFIDKEVSIGARTVIQNNVVIQNRVIIGADCVIESGAIIGTFGFGYYNDNHEHIKKIPDFGGVVIGNRVEIGANTCIARGTLGNTIIGDDVKIDNLVHIAHNAVIRDECLIVAQSLVGGSSTLGKRAYIAPCASIMNQLEVGEHAFVGMGAVVIKNVERNTVVAGVPARFIRKKVVEGCS